MSSNTLGERIKQKMQEKNLTQKQMAAVTGLAQSYISEIVNNKTEPGVFKIHAIARALDMDLHEIITGMPYQYEKWLEAAKGGRVKDSGTSMESIHTETIDCFLRLNPAHQNQVKEIIVSLSLLEQKRKPKL